MLNYNNPIKEIKEYSGFKIEEVKPPMSINMNSKKIKAEFAKETNPRVGLIVLSTDNMIEKDFSKVLSDKPVDLYVNRIKNYNPVTAENLKKMSENITSVADNILPGEKVDCVVFGCTSGTIVSGFDNIKSRFALLDINSSVNFPFLSNTEFA